MDIIKLRAALWIVLGMAMLPTACSQKRKFEGPPGYNINEPQKIVMPPSLEEISGIAFNHGNSDTVYAQEDESGKLYYLKPGDKRSSNFKFGKHGDYEDVQICNNYVIMLRSNGILFTFPFADIHQQEETGNVAEWKDLLPKGEYEGMYADEASKLIYVICKQCEDEKSSKMAKGYILQLSDDGKITQNNTFSVDVKEIESLTGDKKINFRPSALAQNPRTKEWYLVSSINKLLVIADSNWKVTAAYKLNPALYIQPEGIAFDKNSNLYISNEGGDLHSGNILKTTWSGK
ncbi:SdiA-regulated family protein [Niastella caeni]|uniref:SdiA-regulated family protein n=1 Tax=Niastella caeni TaxID=2569763 RepID=A0A4S8HZ84_9BACT|nr:SdiA-regulated family protein [Niastella caeni]THU41123.1 SdiA-regulated family protein [Niastella caeni]